MTAVNLYLNFKGNCEEAFNFYKSIFGGDFTYVGRFKDMPPVNGQTAPANIGNLIMHISLPISKETSLMGSDVAEGFSPPVTFGNNFAVSLNTDSKSKADTFFSKLSAGGKVGLPMGDQFWGAYFGMLTDKFGINWMISVEQNQEATNGQKKAATANA